MRLSIKAVLIGAVVGLQIATVAAILFVTMVGSREAVLGHARQLMEAAAGDVIHRSQQFMRPAQAAVELAQRLAASGTLTSADPAALEGLFTETLRVHPQFAGMYFGSSRGEFFYVNRSDDKSPGGLRTKLVTLPEAGRQVEMRWRDKDGREVARRTDPSDTYDPRQRPWFVKAVTERRLVWTDPYIFFTSRRPGITVAAPVLDARGTVQGVVGVDIEITEISAFLNQLRADTGHSAIILSRDGSVIAHPDGAMVDVSQPNGRLRLGRIDKLADPLASAAIGSFGGLHGPAGFRAFTAGGTEYLAAMVRLPDDPWPWVIAVHAPAAQFLNALQAGQRNTLLMALAVAGLAVAVGLVLARMLARPVAALRADAVAVSEGRFPDGATPPHTAIVEIQQTVDAVHAMLDGLRRAQADLKAANQALEERVAERTQMLREEIVEREAVAEHLRVAKEHADEANRAKSRFLSSMSHELRTPLNAVLGFAQLLKIDRDTLTAEQADWVDHIIGSGQHLLELINQVLDLARIEAGGIGLSIEDVRVDQVVDECLIIVRAQAADRGIDIAQEPLPPGLPRVRADFSRLKQALLNLLSNAVKYNRDGGLLGVRVLCPPGGASVRFEISDTGIGIPETEQGLLFRPFTRLTATRDLVDGTGIGLAITKQLVEMMFGRVGVTSVPGQGSTFWIELPAVQPRRGKAVPAALRDEVTVLYVEDNSSNLKLMEQMLGRLGRCRLIPAETAEIGLQLVRSHHPDLVLMDINLPGMDGYAALAELRRDPETSAIPVIAVTANALPSDRDKALAAGFDAYVAKPLDVREVLSAMTGALAA